MKAKKVAIFIMVAFSLAAVLFVVFEIGYGFGFTEPVDAAGFSTAPPVGESLLVDYFGVTPQLMSQGGGLYSFDRNSLIPVNPSEVSWTETDWFGTWDFSTWETTTVWGTEPSGGEWYDVEAMYLDNDADNIYVVIVTSCPHYYDWSQEISGAPAGVGIYEPRIESYPLYPWVIPGDLCIDLGLRPRDEKGAASTSYDYGIDIVHERRNPKDGDGPSIWGDPHQHTISSMRDAAVGYKVYRTTADAGGSDIGDPYLDAGVSPKYDWYTANIHEESVWQHTNFDPFSTWGTLPAAQGDATVYYYEYQFPGGIRENNACTYIIEATIPRASLGDDNPSPGEIIGIQWVIGNRTQGVKTSSISTQISGTIGDFVWHDADEDGCQDAGEPGISGVTVDLYRAGESSPVASTITDSDGYYSFTAESDNYYIRFERPNGWMFTSKDACIDTLDSDASPEGLTTQFMFSADSDLTSIDAGLIPLADVYVDDDAASGWYDSTHVQTIQEGVDNASLGDTVFVYNGHYSEYVIMDKAINLIGEHRTNTVVEGLIMVNTFNGQFTSPGSCIQNFTIQNGKNDGIIVKYVVNFTLCNCQIQTNINGIVYHDLMLGFEFAWQTTPSHPDWNPVFDLNDDAVVDIFDYTIILSQWGIGSCNIANCDFYSNADCGINVMGPITFPNFCCCNISGNVIENSVNSGIVMLSFNNSSISRNTIINNGNYGVELCHSSNNTIYNNYFRNNTHNAYDDSNNSWNISKSIGANIVEGEYIGGNYWSDYDGADTDDDGLGDTLLPYNCSGGIQHGGDWNPLVPFADVYVDDDAHPSWYDATHVHSVQEGIDNATAGDTVFVYNGTYYENVVVTKPICLMGDNKINTVIEGSWSGDVVVSIRANDVNMSGFTVKNGGETGVEIQSSHNCTLYSNNISGNYYTGLSLYSSNNNSLLENIISNNAGMGLYLCSSVFNTISGNIVASNDEYGIHLFSSSNNTFLQNHICENNDGIWLFSSKQCTIAENALIANNGYGIWLNTSSNNTINDNMVNHSQDGIYLFYQSNTNIIDNNILRNNSCGIRLYSSHDNTITENINTNNTDFGIDLYSSSGNTISSNTIREVGQGIHCTGSSSYNRMVDNVIASTGCGMDIACSTGEQNLIQYNTLYDNSDGIVFESAGNNSILDNFIIHNTYDGIELCNSNDNLIAGNRISENDMGVRCYSSLDNLIYNNYFNNSHNAYDDGNNIWDLSLTPGVTIVGGGYLGGNYWSDYDGADADGDGLGDTLLPYNCSGGIQHGGDWNPLVPFADVYVDDDAHPSWYDATHVHSVQEGIDNASASDTVFVYSGTYEEPIFHKSDVALIGENRDTTVLLGFKRGDHIEFWGLDNFSVSHFTIDGGRWQIGDCCNGVFKDCAMNLTDSIEIGECCNCRFEHCTFTAGSQDFDYDNFIVMRDSDNLSLVNCTVTNFTSRHDMWPKYHDESAICLQGCINSCLINCSLDGNGSCGVLIEDSYTTDSSRNIDIQHCSLTNFSHIGIYIENSVDVNVNHTLLDDNRNPVFVSGTTLEHYKHSFKDTWSNGNPVWYLKDKANQQFTDMDIGYLGFISCHNIRLDNLSVEAIQYVNATDCQITNLSVCNAHVGLDMRMSQHCIVDNCSFINNSVEGVYLGDCENCSIIGSRCTDNQCLKLDGFAGGINSHMGANNSIINCTCSNNGRFGISTYGENISIQNCTCMNNSYGGIFIAGEWTTVKQCSCDDNEWGGLISWADYINIQHCILSHNTQSGMQLGGSHNMVQHCIIVNNTGDGIYAEDIDCSVFDDCVCRNNTGNGIYLEDTFHINITNCTCFKHSNGCGILQYWCEDTRIAHCTCYDNTDGINIFDRCENILLENCTCFNNTGYGIQGGNWDIGSLKVYNCTANNNTDGIRAYIRGDLDIKKCEANHNTQVGIYVGNGHNYEGNITKCSCNNNTVGIQMGIIESFTVTDCSCIDNSDAGIYVEGPIAFIDIISNCTCSFNGNGIIYDAGYGFSNITNGTISHNGVGVNISDCDHFRMHHTNLFKNVIAAVDNHVPQAILATYNWWGHASGPHHASNPSGGNGTGGNISDYVTYSPWLNAPYPDGDAISYWNPTQLQEGDQTVNETEQADVTVTVNATQTQNITIQRLDGNPEPNAGIPQGIGPLGKYIDVAVDNESNVQWPVNITIYYTQAELDAAGIPESSLTEMIYYNESTGQWEAYNDTGVKTTNVAIGGKSYAGYVWANAWNQWQLSPKALGALNEVYVDDDFMSSTPGWQCDHFDVIQDGIDAVAEQGTVYVYNGTYYENVVVDKQLTLLGEDRNGTIIDGSGNGSVIFVKASHVLTDGFTIINGYDNTSYVRYGINIRNNNCTVRNNILINNEVGIEIYDCVSANIQNNTVKKNSGSGITIYMSRESIIASNWIETGINIVYSINITLLNNTIVATGIEEGGGWIFDSSYLSFKNNSFDNPLVLSPYSKAIETYTHFIADTNTVAGRPIYYYINETDVSIPTDAGQIILINCTRTDISGFKDVFIELAHSDSNIISHNVVNSNFVYGLLLVESNHDTIINNDIRNCNYGIFLSGSHNNTVSTNYLENISNYAVLLDSVTYHIDCGGTKNVFVDNTMTNSFIGIGIGSHSNNNSLYGNAIRNSSLYGMYFGSSTANNFMFNNILNNANNAYDDGTNIWNISKTPGTNIIGGPYLGGNYWSDYNGTDTDGDGLGDTNLPYNCSGNIVNGGDWHPLTEVNTLDVGIIDSNIHDGDIRYIGSDTLNVTLENLGTLTASVVVNFTLERDTPSGWVEIGKDENGYELDPDAWVESFFDVSYDVEGEYRATFSLQAPDGGPWSDADPSNDVHQAVFTVISPNQLPVANFTYHPSHPTTASMITFIDHSSDSDGSIVNWTWNMGDGNVSYEQHPQHRYPNAGTYTVILTVTDDDGASDSYTVNVSVRVPSPPPGPPYTPSLPDSDKLIMFDGPAEWNRTHWDVVAGTLICVDMDVARDAGLNSLYYRVDNGSWQEWTECICSCALSPGMHSIYYYGVDTHGRHTTTARIVINVVNSVAPITTCDMYPPHPPKYTGWYTDAVTVSLYAVDSVSDVSTTYYRFNEGNWLEYTGEIVVATDGRYTLEYYSVDNAGNKEQIQSTTFRIDKTSPSLIFKQPTQGHLYLMGREILPLPQTVVIGPATLAVKAGDDTAGIEEVEFYIDDELQDTLTTEPFEFVWDMPTIFKHTIQAIAYDRAGNKEAIEQDIWIFNV